MSPLPPTPFASLASYRGKEFFGIGNVPFASFSDKGLEYLSRYTHRVAISNRRLVGIEDGKITFTYRDRRDGNQLKELTGAAPEFLRRFLQHVTPSGLCRVRHYGFLSNRGKEKQLPRCRELLGQAPLPSVEPMLAVAALILRFTGIDVTCCPHCKKGTLVAVERLFATEARASQAGPSLTFIVSA